MLAQAGYPPHFFKNSSRNTKFTQKKNRTMEKPIKPQYSNGKPHTKKCQCFACDEYNYALIFWEKEQYEKEENK